MVLSFRFCGPGTKLAERLARGDTGINELDNYCKDHDIAYSRSNNLSDRHKADKILGNKAYQRAFTKNVPLGERAAALAISATMSAKRKLGMGLKLRKKRRTVRKKKKKSGRDLLRPKSGGFLPLLFSAITAGSAIASAIKNNQSNNRALQEMTRHNAVMEKNKSGRGFYLKPYNSKK